jgi:hypothetical protein
MQRLGRSRAADRVRQLSAFGTQLHSCVISPLTSAYVPGRRRLGRCALLAHPSGHLTRARWSSNRRAPCASCVCGQSAARARTAGRMRDAERCDFAELIDNLLSSGRRRFDAYTAVRKSCCGLGQETRNHADAEPACSLKFQGSSRALVADAITVPLGTRSVDAR